MNDGRSAVVISWPVSEKKLALATPTTPAPNQGGSLSPFATVADSSAALRPGGSCSSRVMSLLRRLFWVMAWWYSPALAMGLAAG
jgi:hypothetical protein